MGSRYGENICKWRTLTAVHSKREHPQPLQGQHFGFVQELRQKSAQVPQHYCDEE